jgi:hypothetical protein
MMEQPPIEELIEPSHTDKNPSEAKEEKQAGEPVMLEKNKINRFFKGMGGWQWVLLGWTIIIIAFLVALSFIPIGKEPLTELYFNDHLAIPKLAHVNDTYNLSFTINNLEYKDMPYPYKITEKYGNVSKTIAEGNIFLADNTSTSVPFSFSFNETFKRAQVQITLTDKNQSIHLWVDERN